MIDLGTLPGSTESYANAINDSGQIVGYCRVDYQHWNAFLYSNGQMTSLGTLPGDNSSEASDINNSGQIVGWSVVGGYGNQSHAFLYRDGQMTDLNSLIPQDSGWFLEWATAINDKGQIVGEGIIGGQEHAFLLDPLDFTANPEDGITVGNISTKGDSILLNGLKITLTGPSITTNGGEMTFDGPTIIKSSTSELNFDSTVSTDGSGGGDITFTDTLDGHSANTQNLSLKAGQGNITFTQAVGSKATLKDLTVNSAKTVTAEDINSDGDIILKVIDDISTANLSTNDFSKIEISLGKIDEQLYDSSGNVTTGSITAKELDVLSDGGFTATGKMELLNGDVDIIALKDIAVGQITAGNGATNLTSGTGAIAVTGVLESKNGFIALAKQDITTNEIQSGQGIVILNTHQGAITVNGTITASDDVSLSAPEDVVAQEITSQDGGVALISAKGTVTANGAIASMEDVTLGAAEEVVAQGITAQLGTVALVSTEGTINTNGTLDGGIEVVISAKGNVSAGQIFGGTVAINSEQGIVTLTGNVITGGGDVYISASGNVVSQNLISRGGAITVVSERGAVTTGYLRSDGNGTGGKIYLQAFGSIRVISSVNIGGDEYSIYTGINRKGWIEVVHQSSVVKANRAKFLIGDASLNGTAASVFGPMSQKPLDEPSPVETIPTVIILIELIRRLGQRGEGRDPSHVNEINPITNEPYNSDRERELVEKLSRAQKFRLTLLIQNNRVEEEEVFKKGRVDTRDGCFKFELSKHLGQDITHSKYATYVTGSLGDFLVITRTGIPAFYDGLVISSGAIHQAGLQPIGSMAEVKTGSSYTFILRKYLPKNHPNYLSTPLSQEEKNSFQELNRQINRYITVADACHLNFFLSFNNKEAALAAKVLYKDLNLNPRYTPRAIKVHYLKMPANL